MTSSQVPEPIDERNLPRSYDDVRQWLELVESMGELKRIDGADWNLEIGTMAELIYRERTGTIRRSCSIRLKVIRMDFAFSLASNLPIAGWRSWRACRWTAWD
jgi:hypothetical protein